MGRRGTGSRDRTPTRGRHHPAIEGTIRAMVGRAEVETTMGTYRITGRGLHGAMDRDRVAVSLVRGPGGKRRAVVDRVIERAHTSVVGTYKDLGPLGVVRPLDARIKHDFFVLPDDDSPARLGVEPGDIVAARIESYPTGEESGIVSITRLIGDDSAPDLGIQCVMARFGLEDGYSSRALSEADGLSLDVDAALEDPLRRDLRDRFLVTIDPVDALDYDDAISVARTDGGGWHLGVHIADVSHYVPWDSSIDLEARSRATSVYLADRVLPMLPAVLSEDLCSLKADADRLAMTVDIELTARGAVRSYEIYPSVIRSKTTLPRRRFSMGALPLGWPLLGRRLQTRPRAAAQRPSRPPPDPASISSSSFMMLMTWPGLVARCDTSAARSTSRPSRSTPSSTRTACP